MWSTYGLVSTSRCYGVSMARKASLLVEFHLWQLARDFMMTTARVNVLIPVLVSLLCRSVFSPLVLEVQVNLDYWYSLVIWTCLSGSIFSYMLISHIQDPQKLFPIKQSRCTETMLMPFPEWSFGIVLDCPSSWMSRLFSLVPTGPNNQGSTLPRNSSVCVL